MSGNESTRVLGLDIGGTSSRALVADLAGRTVGTGSAGGGNPNSHPPEQAVSQVAAAAREAMAGTDPNSVRAGVLGMAGVSKLADPAVSALFQRTWTELGLSCPVRMVSDCEVAFAAGTSEPSGTVLIAGTGSIAARIDRHRLVATAGGYGWLLGDEGSSFWLGREAVRETLRGLDLRTGSRSELAESVLVAVLEEAAPDNARKRLITAVNATAPIKLAELAPLVTRAARGGDKAAIDIVRRAAGLLADTAQMTRSAHDTSPVVIAGSLVATENPLAEALRVELAARGTARPRTAGPGAAGAAWLAALDALGEEAPELHARLLAQ